MELTTYSLPAPYRRTLFMMSKIQNLNGTHNKQYAETRAQKVVYDVKDTKFEWNSQRNAPVILQKRSCL